MLTKDDFQRALEALGEQGQEDVEWANNCALPDTADEFALEVIYVICNSGMKHAVADGIFRKCRDYLRAGIPVRGNILGKSRKAAAIDKIWVERERFYAEYKTAEDKVAYAKTIPSIGGITCYHVAKNFGAQVAKPDVHLQRLADIEGVTAQALCERLAAETGYKVSVVDTILWRACAYDVIDSRTGKFKAAA